MIPQNTEAEITTQFPGLRVRPIGPGDDIVVSAQVLEEWLAAHDQEVVLQTKFAIHDEYWHSQNYIARHGVGELSLDLRIAAKKELAKLQAKKGRGNI